MTNQVQFDEIEQLIQDGKATEARAMLTAALYRESHNPRTWWLFARVAEDDKQRYYVLSELVKLPTNRYTGPARAWLSRLPYQTPVHGDTRVKIGTLQAKNSSALVLVVGLAMAVLVVGALIVLVLARPGMGGATVAAAPSAAAPLPTANQDGRIVVTRQAPPTITPYPTATLPPTTTPAPTWTPRPPTTTPTPSPIPDMSELLPPLNEEFAAHTRELYGLVDATLTSLSSERGMSVDMLAEQVASIQQLRNDVTLTSLRGIPSDIRQTVIAPAHMAFINYANSALTLMDLQADVNRRQAALADVAVSDLPSAREDIDAQKVLMDQQSELATTRRQALNASLIAYTVFTQTRLVEAQATGQAVIINSELRKIVNLPAGSFAVFARLEETTGATLWLAPASDDTARIELVAGQVIRLEAGAYRVMADVEGWWVIALDPMQS
ncbi:MAG: hypothetical protein IT323_20185 [Anaerolineae bacterium]|nr:hypothetical protein [Anaerolineae bacterium]